MRLPWLIHQRGCTAGGGMLPVCHCRACRASLNSLVSICCCMPRFNDDSHIASIPTPVQPFATPANAATKPQAVISGSRMQPVHSARRSPVMTRRWGIALVIASALALVLLLANPSIVKGPQTHSTHGRLHQVLPHTTPSGRSYLHMVSKPSDAFEKPVKGTWVYFVAVSPTKRHYLHCASMWCCMLARSSFTKMKITKPQ